MGRIEPERPRDSTGQQETSRELLERLGVKPEIGTPLSSLFAALDGTPEAPTEEWKIIRDFFNSAPPSPLPKTEVTNGEIEEPSNFVPLLPGQRALAQIAKLKSLPSEMQIFSSETNSYSLTLKISTDNPFPEYAVNFRNPYANNPSPIDLVTTMIVDELLTEEQKSNGSASFTVTQIERCISNLAEYVTIKGNNSKYWSISKNNKEKVKGELEALATYLRILFRSEDYHTAGIISLCIEEDMIAVDHAAEM